MAIKKLDFSAVADAADAEAKAEAAKPVEARAASKPSPARAAAEGALMDFQDRAQLSYTNFPVAVIRMMEAEAAKLGMGKKEFLLHVLRERGYDIPAYEDLDGRRRR